MQLSDLNENVKTNIKTILENVEEVSVNDDVISSMLSTWFENKKKFIEYFGNQLIYEYPDVEFKVPKERRSYLLSDFINRANDYLYFNYKDFNKEAYAINRFFDFIERNAESFFENLVSNDFLFDNIHITKGMKLSKAFKYFIQDKEVVIAIQQLASSYIQKDKLKGTLCLSVHPYDYLSLSENKCNWRSCHALDGEYCAGNLSYMLDESTVVCYIKSDEDEYLRYFPMKWNNKKWRMLIHFGEDKRWIFLGRQYPYEVEGILEFLEKDVFYDQYYKFQNDECDQLGKMDLIAPYIALNNGYTTNLYLKHEVIKDQSDLHYNDLLRSSCYVPYYTSKKWYVQKMQPRVKVGHKVKCIKCGEGEIPGGEHTFLCKRCAVEEGNYVECYCCGNLVKYENSLLLTCSDDRICNDCYEEGYAHYCGNCEGLFLEENMHYSHKFDCYFCEDCFEDIKEEEYDYRKKEGIYE